MVIAAAGLMYMVEFVADKVPGIDTGWDTIHTFVRIPAWALLAASMVGHVTPAIETSAGILGSYRSCSQSWCALGGKRITRAFY
jgi:hypothetical protein